MSCVDDVNVTIHELLAAHGDGRWVLHDVPDLGGDDTLYSELYADEYGAPWTTDRALAHVMTREDAEDALEECDSGYLLRERIVIRPASAVGR